MGTSSTFVELRQRGAVGWVHADLAGFGLEAFWADLAPLPGAKGRGGVGCLELGGRQLVVRPFRRGGALARLLQDRYPGSSRARRELELLEALRQEAVPVVVPIAAVARRGRAFWRLRLCTEREPDAVPLVEFLRDHPTRRRQAAAAFGTVVRLAFAAGLRHPDLHVDNVLCSMRGDKVRVVLVDLDRARLQKPLPERCRDDMLRRLQRHLVRHRGDLLAVPTRAETMRFLRAFGFEPAARHALWRRLQARLARLQPRRRG